MLYCFLHYPVRTALLRVRAFEWDHSRTGSTKAEWGHGEALERSFSLTSWQLLGGFPQLRTSTNTVTAILSGHDNVQHN